jgi:hypothetical protein
LVPDDDALLAFDGILHILFAHGDAVVELAASVMNLASSSTSSSSWRIDADSSDFDLSAMVLFSFPGFNKTLWFDLKWVTSKITPTLFLEPANLYESSLATHFAEFSRRAYYMQSAHSHIIPNVFRWK